MHLQLFASPFDSSSTETLWNDKVNVTRKRPSTAWIGTVWAMVIHCLLSIGVTILVLVYVEGSYFNVTERTPLVQVLGGTRATAFRLMQSDVVTFLSGIIALLKCALTTWTASLCWRVAIFLMERRGLARRDLKALLSYGQLPPGAYSRDWSTFIIGTLLLASLVANFSSPFLTGSISWVPSNQLACDLSLDPISFGTIENGTLTELSDAYRNRDYERMGVSLEGTGLVSIGWGRGVEKGVLKRVTSSVEALAVNSTIENVTIPYFEVHSMKWIENADEIPFIRDHGPFAVLEKYKSMAPVSVDALSIGSVVLIANGTITPWSSDPLESTAVRETVIAMMYYAANDSFGTFSLTQDLPPGVYTSSSDGFNFAYAWTTYSAGVGRCKEYQCVVSSPSTIQNTTSIELEPHQLTYQSLLMMQVISLSIISQNASIPSPWNNVNDYVEAVLVRAYSGAWTVLNDGMATGDSYSSYLPALPGLQAHVDRSRAYIWLGLQLLVTLLGVLFTFILSRSSKHPLIGNTTLAAFYLDTTEIPRSDSKTRMRERGLFRIEPRGDRLRVTLE
ncbi:transmembrane protein, putative [Rhizoctonia solani AG-3 Rhs1AP]|uniref:Transmembrane protein, putative n=1 Tax=Rhizoctonia solani AG-3 Rhs1AP TaxID=1086054 RepID=X8JE26_9AGAM|nr:transmembrane protein, putative [Rhizoctonia solani AG-3 Rhs1AP]